MDGIKSAETPIHSYQTRLLSGRETMSTRLVRILSACVAVAIAAMMASSLPATMLAKGHLNGQPAAASAGAPRTVDYRWYDAFNVPFGSWWDYRYSSYGTPEILSRFYPHTYVEIASYLGNYVYSSMRLNVTGRNMPEINMSQRPEFLPMLGTARGGNASIDWNMQYLTMSDAYRYGQTVVDNYDGWLVDLSGTVTLDRGAAMTVLGVTSAEFDSFSTWWAANHNKIQTDFKNWFDNEGNTRLDIFNMYEWNLDIQNWSLQASVVGGKVVLSYDMVSWGMEALMARWLHEAFMPAEPSFEGMSFHASIGPAETRLDIDTAVEYALTACIDPSAGGMPYWSWEPALGDYLASTPQHRQSEFDPYASKTYNQTAVGNANFGYFVPYDYTPAAWNLSTGETLSIAWPVGNQVFYLDDGAGWVTPLTEPMFGDSQPNDVDLSSVNINESAGVMTFTGPMDAWGWSRNQSADQALADEWARLGILPYGIPSVSFYPDLPPIAAFVVDPATGGNVSTVFTYNASSSIDLEDASSDMQYRWDWNGDGVWDTSWNYSNVSTYQYTSSGTYNVRLEAMDSVGLTDIAIVALQVGGPANTPPVASFTIVPAGGDVTQMFEFNASGSSDNEDPLAALQVRWDFNNDAVWDTGWLAQKDISHMYSTPGTYTVKLQVRDSAGLTSTTTLDVVVTASIPEFSYVLVPVVWMISLMIMIVAFRKRREQT